MFYTPMGGLQIINVLVYAHFGGSHNIKFQPFTLVGICIVGILTEYIKNKIENRLVKYLYPSKLKIANTQDNKIMLQ